MKKYILLLLLYINASAQIYLWDDKTVGSAVNFGTSNTTKYMSVTPVAGSLDINGSERITVSSNRDFEANIGNWIAVGSAVVSQDNTQKHAGTYSAKNITSGFYSGMQLPFSTITALVVGEKYTLQVWIYLESADTAQIIIGDKSFKKSIATTTWTLFAYNFIATSNTVNQNIQILFRTTGKTNYVDDVSLTRFYPLTMSLWFNSNNNGVYQSLLANRTTSFTTGSGGFQLRLETSNKVAFYIGDGAPSSYNSRTTTATYVNAKWHLVTVVIDYNLIQLFVDNENTYTALTIGNSNTLGNLIIGKESYGSGSFFSGYIGEVQFLQNYAKSYQEHYSEWKNGMRKYTQEKLRVKFKGTTTTDFLRDWSGTGNNLSGTNVDIQDKTKGSAPYYQR
jgi:hypothetical protein